MLGSFDVRILKRDLGWWLPDNSIGKVMQITRHPACTLGNPGWLSEVEVETHRVVGFAQDATDHPPVDIDVCEYKARKHLLFVDSTDHSTLAVPSRMDLKKLYVHHSFVTFLWAVSAAVADIESQKPSRGHLFGQAAIQSFRGEVPAANHGSSSWNDTDKFHNEKLSTLVQEIETTGLGPVDDIYFGILPPLSAWSLLPPVHAILKRGLELGHQFEQQGKWGNAARTYVSLQERTELFPRDSSCNNTDIASEATALVMEHVRAFTEIANFREGQLFHDDIEELSHIRSYARMMSDQLAVHHEPAIFPRLMGLYERQGRVWKCDLIQMILPKELAHRLLGSSGSAWQKKAQRHSQFNGR